MVSFMFNRSSSGRKGGENTADKAAKTKKKNVPSENRTPVVLPVASHCTVSGFGSSMWQFHTWRKLTRSNAAIPTVTRRHGQHFRCYQNHPVSLHKSVCCVQATCPIATIVFRRRLNRRHITPKQQTLPIYVASRNKKKSPAVLI